jgi:hypothetical protein
MIKFDCSCGKKLRIEDKHKGKKVRCPACKSVHTTPDASSSYEEDYSVLSETIDDIAAKTAAQIQKCPYCQGEITKLAKKCRHCGEWLEPNPQKTAEPKRHNTGEKKEIFGALALLCGCLSYVILPVITMILGCIFSWISHLRFKKNKIYTGWWIFRTGQAVLAISIFLIIQQAFSVGFTPELLTRGTAVALATSTIPPIIENSYTNTEPVNNKDSHIEPSKDTAPVITPTETMSIEDKIRILKQVFSDHEFEDTGMNAFLNIHAIKQSDNILFPYELILTFTTMTNNMSGRGSATYAFTFNKNLEMNSQYVRTNEHYLLYDRRVSTVVGEIMEKARTAITPSETVRLVP